MHHPRIESGRSGWDTVRGRSTLGISSSAMISGSSRGRFKIWAGCDLPVSMTSVDSVDAEEGGGLED